MPLPRVLLFSFGAMVLFLATFWTMNVNFPSWLGAWLSPNNQYAAGFGVLIVFTAVFGYFYAHYVGTRQLASGPIRGVLFGAALAVGSIFVVPAILSGMASVIGNAQIVFRGKPDATTAERTAVDACPPVGDFAPPFGAVTEDGKWAEIDHWQSRLIPFGVAFLLYGLTLGVFLSEEQTKR